MKKNICCWSGGKDSSATIEVAHELGIKIDAIVMSEVMYDLKRDISGENPEHIKWVREYAKPLFESWGYKVYILRSNKYDYVTEFNHVIKRAPKNPDHIGKRYGFCLSKRCSVKRDCKEKPINDFKNAIIKNGETFVDIVGIAADETKRLKSLYKNPNKRSLLAEEGITEEEARSICKNKGLLSPSYKYTNRNGCWFCPNAKLCECKCIQEENPEAWNEFVDFEDATDLAFDKYNPFIKEDKVLHRRNKLISSMTMEECLNYSKKNVSNVPICQCTQQYVQMSIFDFM